MEYNAYILDWTMDRYPQLRQALTAAGFACQKEDGSEHIRVSVPFERVQAFAAICQPHLNAPFNYIDVQFPSRKTTVLIFRQQTFTVTDPAANEQVIRWALAQGLPEAQADWATSF